MDFLFAQAIFLRTGRARAPHALGGRKEGQVKNLNVVRDVGQSARNDEAMFASASGARFTSAEFFTDAGTVIAVCLGLGLLMRLVLG
jgi:hypothetical protein